MHFLTYENTIMQAINHQLFYSVPKS